ncbi:hypothetical protein [Microbacterium sp. SS28]|uniref:hypothetical protein n=1 Tax=Microbacterium sp. SS28 TaxID=2919948 RepID=UPI0035B1F43E
MHSDGARGHSTPTCTRMRNPNDRARLGRDFNSAREARDILVRYTSDPRRKPYPGHPSSGASEQTARPQATRAETPRPSAPSTPPPRVTMQFDEFVIWADTAGFGAGARSPRYTDWARIIVWSSLGILVMRPASSTRI